MHVDYIRNANCHRAFFKDFSVEGPTTKRDFKEKRKSGEVFPFSKIFVFLSSLDVISCNFSMIFAHFQTKRDITRGAKTLQWGGQHRGWGGFGPPSIYVKKGPELSFPLSIFSVIKTYCFNYEIQNNEL